MLLGRCVIPSNGRTATKLVDMLNIVTSTYSTASTPVRLRHLRVGLYGSLFVSPVVLRVS